MKTLSTKELAHHVAQEMQSQETQTQATLERFIALIKKEIQRGNKIDLTHFMTFSVKHGEIDKNHKPGQEPPLLPPPRTLNVKFDDDFRRLVEGNNIFEIMLVVPVKNFFTGVMAARLSGSRTKVTVVQGEETAINHIQNEKVDLVILDVGLKNGPKVVESIKKNKDLCMTATISILAAYQDPNKVSGLEFRPDETIVEPFELGDLVKLSEAQLSTISEQRNFFDQSVHFRLASSDEMVDKANEVMGELLSQSGLDEEAALAQATAFREAIDNAHRHGNKGNEEHSIDVQYYVDSEKVTIAVLDSGDGFDTEVYLSRSVTVDPVEAARQRHREGRVGGLGIMLMLKCVDKLEYNYRGNEIKLYKFIRKAIETSAPEDDLVEL